MVAEGEFPTEELKVQDDGTYICDNCGEEIVVPIDPSEGESQEYTEDCPVCCHPNVISVSVGSEGEVNIDSRSE
ncbi:MAG: CPXCG motif-containing cysteine-rich protein [Fuerstiella sp.]|nr:CPXCG motif-containing cysteine-rich protein [Fuerstiella sp.]MCP4856347.1 CPXCG motif-containing cysteine-rich protein [Fuerstiella sp.]